MTILLTTLVVAALAGLLMENLDRKREINILRSDLRYEQNEIKHLREEKCAVREWQAVVESHLEIQLVNTPRRLVVIDKS